jgi:hypothetical protein
MPITQSRLLDLLTEHEANVRAYRSLLDYLSALVDNNALSGEDLRDALRMTIGAASRVNDTFARLERRHYDSNARRNDRLREKARQARRAAGVPERDSLAYRAQSMRFRQEREEMEAYNAAMGGKGITEADITRHDDTARDPAQWSPERLAAEATRGSVNLDDDL